MQYEWDENKAATNIENHGMDFMDAAWFEWDTAMIKEDCRLDYGEKRCRALGYIMDRLMILIFALCGDAVRIISLRKANKREEKYYGNRKNDH